MRKAYVFILVLISTLLFFITVRAEEITYQNVITDSTSIEEDFQVLGMDIDDYYMPQSYDYAKWYVVAMAEAYIDSETVQTYFYIFNPKTCEGVEINELYYTLNNASNHLTVDSVFNFNSHGLYKVKGFSYAYTASANIKITKIDGAYISSKTSTQSLSFLGSLPPIGTDKSELSSESDFEANVSHNLDNETLSINLEYDSTLIIDEKICISVKIPQESSIFQWWDNLWELHHKELWLDFYNFNFPDNIKPDSINYAKFAYDYNVYKEHYWEEDLDYSNLYSSERLTKEYFPGSTTFQTNKHSAELEFQTFVLGNRITKNEFGYVDMTDLKQDFEYDCSVLLDSHINTYRYEHTGDDYTKEKYLTKSCIEEIDFLELYYTKDGIQYKCEVKTSTIDKPVEREPSAEKSLWEQIFDFFVAVGTFITENILGVFGLGEIAKAFLGGAATVLSILLGIVLIVVFFPQIIKFVIWIFKTVFKIIWFIVSLPFRLLGKLFKRK